MSANRFSEPPSLEGFVRYFLGLDFKHMAPREFYDFGNVLSLVLYRDAPWQTELFILRPGLGFPRQHRHPDVDAYEYLLSERIPFFINGRDRSRGAGALANTGTLGVICEVRSSDWHGVGNVPEGGTFLSIQEWKNGVVPTSVGLNWEGTPTSLQQKALLRTPGAKWIKTIHHRDTEDRSEIGEDIVSQRREDAKF